MAIDRLDTIKLQVCHVMLQAPIGGDDTGT